MASPLEVSKITTLTGHRDCIYTLEKTSDPDTFFSAGADGLVVKWNLKESEDGELLANVNNSVYALKFLEDKNLLVIGQNFSGFQIVDLAENKVIKTVALPKFAIFDFIYYVKQQLLYIGMGDGSLILVETVSFSVKNVIQAGHKSLRCLALNEAKKELAAGFSDHKIRIFNAETLELKQEIDAHTNSVFTLAYTPDFEFLLSAGRDAHLRIWKANKNYQEHSAIIAHLFTINHLVFSPNGMFFATCSMDKSIKVWDAKTFQLLKVIDKARHAGHGTSVNKLFWPGTQNTLVSCSDDRSISVWDIKVKLRV